MTMKSLRVLLAAAAILAVPALVAGCHKGLSEEEKVKASLPAAGPADKVDKDDHSIKNE